MRNLRGAALIAAVVGAIYSSTTYGAAIYNDRNLFVPAAGPGLQFEGFEGITTDANGEAAFSDGAVFGGGAFSLDALSLNGDVQVTGSGLIGTFMVRTSTNPDIDVYVGAGGIAGSSDPRDDDDFSITFVQPLRAFGILIMENRIESGETLSLLDEDGQTILSVPLPGSNSGLGGNGFRGFVLSDFEPSIKSIVVEEGQVLNDDMWFDWVYFDPVPEPSVLTVCGIGISVLLHRRTA